MHFSAARRLSYDAPSRALSSNPAFSIPSLSARFHLSSPLGVLPSVEVEHPSSFSAGHRPLNGFQGGHHGYSIPGISIIGCVREETDSALLRIADLNVDGSAFSSIISWPPADLQTLKVPHCPLQKRRLTAPRSKAKPEYCAHQVDPGLSRGSIGVVQEDRFTYGWRAAHIWSSRKGCKR